MQDAGNRKQSSSAPSPLGEARTLNPNVDLVKIAFRHRVLIALIGLFLFLHLAAFAAEALGLPSLFRLWLPVVGLAIIIAGAVEMVLLTYAMGTRGFDMVPLLIMIVLPVANIVLLFTMLAEANTFLRFAGVRTSLLGASRKAVLFAMRTPICLECGYNLTGNTSGRCPECGRQMQAESNSASEPSVPLAEPVTAIPLAQPVVEDTTAQ